MIIPSRILHEDNHIIIYNKPPGLLVQGDETGDVPLLDLLKSFLKKKYNKPGNTFLGTIHRLDRPTSGCIVYAKTSKALSRMTQLFADREITKVYWALTTRADNMESDTLINHIEKIESKNKVVCLDRETKFSKKAILEYKVKARFKKSQLLRVNLKTGRKHQIRVQLSKIGCTIIGDLKYGYNIPNKDKSICLHCRSLEFIHPVSKETINVVAELFNIPEWAEVNSSYKS